MTARDHYKMLGIFFAIHAGLQALIYGLLIVFYGGIGAFIGASAQGDERFAAIFMLAFAVIAFFVALVMVVPQALAAFKILKQRGGARFWAIFGAIVSLFNFPFGTALGVYALWFLCGDKSKELDGNRNLFAPPPPPNSWQ